MTDGQQEVRDFLEKKIKEKGFSLNGLSLQLGKNSTYLFHFIKRHSPRRLDEQTRSKLAQLLGVAEQRLCDYQLGTNLIQDKLTTLSGLLGIGKAKAQAIDVIDMSGEYKGKFSEIKNNIIGTEAISSELVKLYGFKNIDDIIIIKNSGDAMYPTIADGDFLWIDTTYNRSIADGIYLIEANETTLLRRIQINPFDNTLRLSADNQSYQSFVVHDYKDIKICGKVVLCTHKL